MVASCPRWCIRAPGHGLASRDGVLRRVHVSVPVQVGDRVAELEQHETVTPAGEVAAGPLRLAVGEGVVPLVALLAGEPTDAAVSA